MKDRLQTLTVMTLAAVVVATLAAHPHMMRKSSLGIGQGKEFTLQHVTVPYNEANPNRLAVGNDWTVPASKFVTPIDLVSGSKEIPAGEYKVVIHRQAENDFRMALGSDSGNHELATEFKDGQPDQDHLLIDLRPTGDKGHLDMRFGGYLISGSFEPKSE